MPYHVTTNITDAELDLFTLHAETQADKVLAFYRANPRKDFSPSDVHRACFSEAVPLTSVRRAISDLTDEGKLVMVENVVKTGPFGRPEHLWRLK